MSLFGTLVRFKFRCTSRKGAGRIIRREAEETLAAVRSVTEAQGAEPTRVNKMPGVDEDMRDWSMYQALEHNVIVNRAMTGLINHIANGSPAPPKINPKTDVMPSLAPGQEQIAAFEASIAEHFEVIAKADNLRGTPTHPHPLLGPINAHNWHCMFGFHLMVHRRQLQSIAKRLQGNTIEQ